MQSLLEVVCHRQSLLDAACDYCHTALRLPVSSILLLVSAQEPLYIAHLYTTSLRTCVSLSCMELSLAKNSSSGSGSGTVKLAFFGDSIFVGCSFRVDFGPSNV
jgi:hypothetical protein